MEPEPEEVLDLSQLPPKVDGWNCSIVARLRFVSLTDVNQIAVGKFSAMADPIQQWYNSGCFQVTQVFSNIKMGQGLCVFPTLAPEHADLGWSLQSWWDQLQCDGVGPSVTKQPDSTLIQPQPPLPLSPCFCFRGFIGPFREGLSSLK
uniref:Uncharacterized protein n=1 Tax=Lynx canadensis TaxID=61383 RepID=A0A667G179_LYNCA